MTNSLWPPFRAAQALRWILYFCLTAVSLECTIAYSKGYQDGSSVRLIVTNAPGTAPDVIGRTLADGMRSIRREPVLVDTKVGVQGMIGGDYVVRSPADGATLLFSSDTVSTVLPHLPEKMSFDPLKDLKPIAMVADAAFVLVAHPSLHVRTLDEFVHLAKSKPGLIDYASTGINSSHNRTMVEFMKMSGIDLNEIPYGRTGPLVDVLGGTVPVMWSGLPGAIPHIQSGDLIALAVSSIKRHPSLPKVPTVDELGYRGFNEVNWFGVMGPKDMPEALVKHIEHDVLQVVRSKEFKELLTAQGMTARAGTHEEYARQIQIDYVRNKNRIHRTTTN